MTDKFTMNEKGFEGEGILSTIREFSPYLFATLAIAAVTCLLIYRCRSNSVQRISGSTVSNSKVLQSSDPSFWKNSEQFIDNTKILNRSNVVQKNRRK